MSRAGDGSAAIPGGTVAMQRVQELDAAEREAIGNGDWTRLGDVLDQQRELWRALMAEITNSDDHTPPAQATAAIAELHRVRRRNHALISAQVVEFRRRLAGLQLAQEGRAAYHSTAAGPI